MKVAIFVDLDHTLINKIGPSYNDKEVDALFNYFSSMEESSVAEVYSSIEDRVRPHTYTLDEGVISTDSIIRPNAKLLLDELSSLDVDLYILSRSEISHISSAMEIFNIGDYFVGTFSSRDSNLGISETYEVGILLDDKFNPDNPSSPKNKHSKIDSNMRKKHKLIGDSCSFVEHIRVPPYNLFNFKSMEESLSIDLLDVEELVLEVERVISEHGF